MLISCWLSLPWAFVSCSAVPLPSCPWCWHAPVGLPCVPAHTAELLLHSPYSLSLSCSLSLSLALSLSLYLWLSPSLTHSLLFPFRSPADYSLPRQQHQRKNPLSRVWPYKDSNVWKVGESSLTGIPSLPFLIFCLLLSSYLFAPSFFFPSL